MKIFQSFILLLFTNYCLAQCLCGNYVGTHCSSRSNDGSNLLYGSCEEDALYHCSSINGIPEVKAYCTECQTGDKKGTDRCAL